MSGAPPPICPPNPRALRPGGKAGAPRVITFGCRLNAFESEVMRELALKAGLAGAVIVNTCAVTAEAERQARQAIRRARRENPGARIIVTGCAAQLKPESFAAMPEVDRVLGNREKLDLGALAEAAPRVRVADAMAATGTAGYRIAGFNGRARAFVEVQHGCDHRCTFCVIPFARGPSRSVPGAQVVAQVQELARAGIAEVVLTGVDIASYGADLSGRPSLGVLVRTVLAQVPELARLRLSTVDPAVADAALLRALAEEERLMPHLHLSLQAMDDLTLKRMRRRHGPAEAFQFVARARAARPDVVFGADVIAGFPSEDETMFRNTLAGIEALAPAFLHVFPYSPRPDTPAARMPQVPAPVRRERAARLRQLGQRLLAQFLAGRVGTTARVLVERGRDGRSEHDAPVGLSFDAPAGALVDARIGGVADGRLIGLAAA